MRILFIVHDSWMRCAFNVRVATLLVSEVSFLVISNSLKTFRACLLYAKPDAGCWVVSGCAIDIIFGIVYAVWLCVAGVLHRIFYVVLYGIALLRSAFFGLAC